MQAKTFKALGVLLWYPMTSWINSSKEIVSLIASEGLLLEKEISALKSLAEDFGKADVFELQEEFVDTFDSIRSHSLHLFEHVHGDSRDRGQAMVDLSERYKEQGLVLESGELPDFLPAFLEYLSLLPKEVALEEISEIGHILQGMGKRLKEKGSRYHVVLDCLTLLAGLMPETVEKGERKPIDFAEIDREWEERPIEFLGAESPQNGGCNTGGCQSTACGVDMATKIEKMMQGERL